MAKKRKVLLIGWDAADWKIINPLMDAGKMPAFKKIVENGVMGNIATLDPPLSPMLWTSIATGKRADKHGIMGFVEPDPESGGIRNVNSTSRTTRAIWNILHHEGYKSNIVGWWPSHPAEPINGVMISNFYQKASNEEGKPWVLQDEVVFPKEYEKVLSVLRVHPLEITEQHLLPFVPDAANVNQDEDKHLRSIAKILAENASIQAATTWLMRSTEWDFTAVYFDGIDHFSHAFMSFYPPQLPGLPDNLYNLYKGVVEGAYIFHDMMLERLIELAGDDTLVLIVSDHGFYSDHLRPLSLPKFGPAPAYAHSPYGVFVMSGEGIKKDELIFGATLLDVTPTLLAAIGLPIGKDMDGKVLVNAFSNTQEIKYIDSWDTIEGDFGEHPEHKRASVGDSMEALQQLVELGYIEDPGEDKANAQKTIEAENKYNLAKVYFSKADYSMAKTLLEELLVENVMDVRVNMDLANCYMNLKEFENVRGIVERLSGMKEDDENRQFVNMDLIEGQLLFAEGKSDLALEKLRALEEKNPYNVQLQIELGKVYLAIRNFELARIAFVHVIQLDINNAVAFHGLAVALLRLGHYEEAAERALDAIGLRYHYPNAHYLLGEALLRLQLFQDAANAFELTLTMNSAYFRARKWLVEIYSKHLNNSEKSIHHQRILDLQLKGKITIVSGFPDSGFEILLKVLAHGGIEPFPQLDEDNIVEHAMNRVNNRTKDFSWLADAHGKVMLLPATSLKFLPLGFEYRIVFLLCPVEDLIGHQQQKENRKNQTYPLNLINAYNDIIHDIDTWVMENPTRTILYVQRDDLFSGNGEALENINKFLDFRLDIDGMTKVVDTESDI